MKSSNTRKCGSSSSTASVWFKSRTLSAKFKFQNQRKLRLRGVRLSLKSINWRNIRRKATRVGRIIVMEIRGRLMEGMHMLPMRNLRGHFCSHQTASRIAKTNSRSTHVPSALVIVTKDADWTNQWSMTPHFRSKDKVAKVIILVSALNCSIYSHS